MDSKIGVPRRKKRVVFIPARCSDNFVPVIYEVTLPQSGTVLEVKRSLADTAGIIDSSGGKSSSNPNAIDIESKTLMFSVYTHCIHRVFQNDSKSNVLEDVDGLLYLCEVKSSKSFVDIELTNRLPFLQPFGHPTVIPIPRPQLSSIDLADLRQIIRNGIAPFLKGGWGENEKDTDLYSIVIMDEAASTVRHNIQYESSTVNLKQFVGKRGGFSVSLLWTNQSRKRYIDRFHTFLSDPKPLLVSDPQATPTGGFPDAIFVNAAEVSDFICSICMDVVRDPLETECGHLFCTVCISSVIDSKKPQLCPMKCGVISRQTVQPLGNFTKRKLANFEVKCESAPECDWTGRLSQFTDHMIGCSFAMVECNGCLEKMRAHEFTDHVVQDCVYRIEECPFCDQKQLQKELNIHQAEECTKAPKGCVHDGCDFVGRRDELETHLVTCLHRPLGCPYHRFGCEVQLKDAELTVHVAEATATHLEMVMHKVDHLETQIDKLRDMFINPREAKKRG